MKEHTKSANYLGLTADQFDRFTQGCRRVWQIIGADMMAALDANAGLDAMPRADVIELVLDADHLARYGAEQVAVVDEDWNEFYTYTLDPWLDRHSQSPAFNRLMKQVFPYELYT
jgi:hypothetical protein